MDPRRSIEGFGYDMSSFAPQPPQIFGAQDADGNPIAPTLPAGNYFTDHGDPNGDDNDPKRRRIARACDMCRKKKIKCDGKLPKCGHCINYKTECVFTQVEKKRNPPKGAKYIEGLENRLGRMESLLKMSGLLSEEEAGRTDLGTLEKRLADKARSNSQARGSQSPHLGSGPNSTSLKMTESQQGTPSKETTTSPRDSMASPISQTDTEKQQEVESLSDLMCSLVTTSQGETRFIGSSSAFSIFSQKGIEWVNEKTGDNSFEETIQNAVNEDDLLKWQLWKPDVFGDLFMRRVFKPLPPKEEAMGLFKDFFENFNSMFPLFHEPTFMHLAERQYTSEPYEGSGWWACMNVALAISHRIRVMSNVVPHHDDQKAWMYLKNAMGVLTELTMKNQDLLSVQALFGMALYLQGTPNPQPAFLLISSGLRLAHSIGLHKKGASFNLHPIEAEQRKRVFWIGYMLDSDSSLRSGRPPVQDDDDMNVDLPSEDPPDNIGNIPLLDGKGKVNLFRLLCEFALISHKVYKNLYSVAAARQSDGELLNTIGDVDKELEIWKDKIPIEFRPEHEIKTSHTPLILQIVVLHFSYYNLLTTIHRMSVHHGYWTSRLAEYAIQGLNARPLNPRIFSSAALCVSAARASVNLIKYLPQGDFACVWLIIYFPVSALVTIFANILQNPQDQRARADIKLMELVVNFLSNIVNEEGTGAFKRMLSICGEFTRIARLVLDKAEKEGMKRKRKMLPEENHQAMQAAMAQAQASGKGAGRSDPSRMQQPQANNLYPQVSGFNAGSMPASSTVFTPGTTMSGDRTMNINEMGAELGEMFGQAGFSSPSMGDVNLQANGVSPLNVGSFQQPFLPQDLWQMPMTFEWDWANIDPNYTTFDGTDGINVHNGMPHQ